jgi:capsular exopolysaccharide synthesis family protein
MPLTSPMPQRQMPSEEPEGLRLREVWGILTRNKWVILASVVLATAGAVAYALKATRIYQAKTTIRIETKEPNIPGIFRAGANGSGEIATEIEVLRSRALVEDAIRMLGLQMVVTEPRGVVRSQVVSQATIPPSVRPGSYAVEHLDNGTFRFRRGFDGSVAGEAKIGVPAQVDGMTLTLAPGAARRSGFVLQVQNFEEAVARVAASIDVSQPSREAQILVVSYQSPDPDLVWQVPNAITQRFMVRRQEGQKTEATSAVAFLHQQIDTISAQLARAEDALRRFREREQVVDPGVEASTQVTRYVGLQADRSTVEAERDALARLLAEVKDSAAKAKPDAPSPYRRLVAFPTLLRNQSAADLLRSLSALEDQRADLLSRRTPNDPDVKALSERISELEEQLRTTVTTYLQGLTNQTASLDTTLSHYGQQLSRVPYRQLEFERLERQPKILNDMYGLLQTRLKEAEIAQAVQDASVRVVDPAIAPLVPIKPRRAMVVMAGFVLGILLGVGLAFLRELFDRSVHTRNDVLLATGLPVLGLIPRIPTHDRRHAIIAKTVRKGRSKGATGGRVQITPPPAPPPPAPPSVPERRPAAFTFLPGVEPEPEPVPFQAPAPPSAPVVVPEAIRDVPQVTIVGIGTSVTEAYGSLQTNLLYSPGDHPLQTFVFTSALPGDGKTTNAVNLAFTLAQRGVRVILVDADLRRGLVHQLFEVARTPGVTDVLAGRVSLAEATHVVDVEDGGSLHFLTTGRVPFNPIATLESEAMTSLIARLRETFEVVIIDAPPINILTDAAVLGANADGVVIVARAGVTQSGALEYSMQQLSLVRARVLGVVLNDIDFRRDSSYDSTYRYYKYDNYTSRET